MQTRGAVVISLRSLMSQGEENAGVLGVGEAECESVYARVLCVCFHILIDGVILWQE